MKTRSDRQLNLPAYVRVNQTSDPVVRPQSTHEDPDAVASALFDEALTNARIETPEVARLFGVSESVVRRMRSKNARERVSFGQMLRLPPAFHWQLHKAMNRRYGFGRVALRQLLEAAGDLAVAVE